MWGAIVGGGSKLPFGPPFPPGPVATLFTGAAGTGDGVAFSALALSTSGFSSISAAEGT
jgi:hypothetical protein